MLSDVATATREYDEPISIPTATNVSVDELMMCIIVVELISIPAATNVSVEKLMVCLIVEGFGS